MESSTHSTSTASSDGLPHVIAPATAGRERADRLAFLRHTIDDAGQLLPAQGPITVFIHHNTLHAFEELPFERAVVEGGHLLGCEPFLSAPAYRAAMASGRISPEALSAVIRDELGEGANETLSGRVPAGEVLELLLRFGVPPAAGHRLTWLLIEGDATRRLRADVPDDARQRLLAASPAGLAQRTAEARVTDALWHEARSWMRGHAVDGPIAPPVRLRDLLLRHTHVDTDHLVHPFLIRLSGAFLDQGMAQWPLPAAAGFREAVAGLYAGKGSWTAEPWLRRFSRLLNEDHRMGHDDLDSILASLEALGIPQARWGMFLQQTVLRLRGWAGMFRQFETRPDRVPVREVPATLAGFLAVRLLADRAATEQVAREQLGWRNPLQTLWTDLAVNWQPPRPRSRDELAWPLFHVFQLLGLAPAELAEIPAPQRERLVALVRRYDDEQVRRLLHLAYERSYYDRALGALAAHRPAPTPAAPGVQVVCCLDEREESFRRHLEELDPGVETLGYAGFFGIAMAFRGLDDAHSRPLCPVALVPEHEVLEVPAERPPSHIALRRLFHRSVARQQGHVTAGGATLVRGTLAAGLLGVFAAIPLVARVLIPGYHARLKRHAGTMARPRPTTRLALEWDAESKPERGTLLRGFTVDEMGGIVERVLQEMGALGRLAPLVVVLGHGSTSLNNPHESAHDCGACGGGRGGPNARAFAAMANNPDVRAWLAMQGVLIPAESWFVGGEHNTCDDAVELFDVEVAPEPARARLNAFLPTIDRARTRNAHERSRRYESVPTWIPEPLALAHVVARANDLAQPRPEYGHATNAVCIIGPRSSTRGLYMDRRAFLISYDDTTDPDGSVLRRVAGAALPVVAGISLEYYFSVVDPTGYGCGTKLPHNVTGLLGVMDGHSSDLRTGLPWQMVEIHEPMRLLVVMVAPPSSVVAFLASDASAARLVRNRWIRLIARDPASGRFFSYEGDEFVPFAPPEMELPEAASSRAWYGGERDHLGFAAIVPVGTR